MKLESTDKFTGKFETIPQCILFLFSLFFSIYLKNKCCMRLIYFLFAFVCLYSCSGLPSHRCTFIQLKACNQIHLFTLDFIYICDELVSFHFSLLCLKE